MNIQSTQLHGLAQRYQLNPELLRNELDSIIKKTSRQEFFIFRTAGQGGASGDKPKRQRNLLAFPSPDAAISFAQRNGLFDAKQPVRTRRLHLLELIEAMLRDPNLALLVLADDSNVSVGQLPTGLHLQRTELLRRLGLQTEPDTEI